MKTWKIYSIIVTIILVVVIIGFGIYAFFFNETITEEEAKNIAVEYANLTESDVTISSVNKDTEDREYEISFFDNNYEYDVDVNYSNGKVKKFEKDIKDDVYANTNTNTETNQNTNENTNTSASTSTNTDADNNINNNTSSNTSTKEQYISTEEAKEIALNHAGIKSDNVTFNKVELDVDHDIAKYEIEFYYNYVEYEYELNAVTGEILKYEKGR